jgi:hypothetical protein
MFCVGAHDEELVDSTDAVRIVIGISVYSCTPKNYLIHQDEWVKSWYGHVGALSWMIPTASICAYVT